MNWATIRIPTPVGSLGNSWQFDLGHSQPGIGWEFVQYGWESTKNVSLRKMTQQNNLGKVGNFASEKSWEPCSFVWKMVVDEHMKSWEMVGNLLIAEL